MMRLVLFLATLGLFCASNAQAQLTVQDQRFVHGYADVEFPLPLPNLVCGMGGPAEVWGHAWVDFGRNARCGPRRNPNGVRLGILRETYNEEDLFTYQEIAERRCGGRYSTSVELAEVPPIAGMIAFRCRTPGRNDQGHEWVVDSYLLLYVSGKEWTEGFPPQPSFIWDFQMVGPPEQAGRVREYLATIIAGMRRLP